MSAQYISIGWVARKDVEDMFGTPQEPDSNQQPASMVAPRKLEAGTRNRSLLCLRRETGQTQRCLAFRRLGRTPRKEGRRQMMSELYDQASTLGMTGRVQST